MEDIDCYQDGAVHNQVVGCTCAYINNCGARYQNWYTIWDGAEQLLCSGTHVSTCAAPENVSLFKKKLG